MKTANPPSFKSCWQRAIGESDLPPTTRLVLLTLSVHFMDENGGHCYPKIVDLIQVTGLSKPHVIRHLNLAIEVGWLERRSWGKGRGYRRWNYQAVFPQAMESKVCHFPQDSLSDDLVTLGNQEADDLVIQGDHKSCRDITMERESNHARARAAATPVSASATAPALSVSEPEKNRMTKLTDAVIEAAQKTIRQRNVREDLSDAALSHSIEKCRALKGYCEMTEAAWIETVVQWVGKERCENSPKTRWETCSPSTPIIPSPEEKKRQNAEFEARMVAAEAQHQQRLEGYYAAHPPLSVADPVPSVVERPVDPVQALQALAAKVRRGATTAPAAPAQRTFGPMGALPARRPPLTAERRDALNAVLREMQKARCSAEDLTQVYQGVHDASEDAWPAVIAQARQRLVVPGQAVA